MTIRSIALSAMAVTLGLCAAESPVAPLAVYYTFDTPPPAALVTEMESEMGRILAAAGVRVAWRDVASPRNGEDFPALVVFRFRGVCSFDQDREAIERLEASVGQPLAETDIANGEVLPFGAVDCESVRRYIAPALKSVGREEKNAVLGRAIARVSAHEIYHMLTGSEEHARRGIARARHSREELTAPTFAFAQKETDWLRAWVAKPGERLADAALEQGTNQAAGETAVPGSISSAGR
jgi:hypothetical protein